MDLILIIPAISLVSLRVGHRVHIIQVQEAQDTPPLRALTIPHREDQEEGRVAHIRLPQARTIRHQVDQKL